MTGLPKALEEEIGCLLVLLAHHQSSIPHASYCEHVPEEVITCSCYKIRAQVALGKFNKEIEASNDK